MIISIKAKFWNGWKTNINTYSVRTEKSEYCTKIETKQYRRIKNILTFLRLDYRDASLLKLYLVVYGLIIPNIKWIGKKYQKSTCLKRTCIYYRVATLLKSNHLAMFELNWTILTCQKGYLLRTNWVLADHNCRKSS